METISEFKGLNGNIVAFKEAVGDVEKVTFLGTPGVCTPFAALFSYAIRDKESHFISGTNIDKCHQFEFELMTFFYVSSTNKMRFLISYRI